MKEKTIGILGGMGPEATLDLFGKIIRNTPATRDQDHLRVVIDNNPKTPDRTPAILNDGPSPVSVMAAGGEALFRVGADFIIIPCISAHYFLEELAASVRLPILSAFDVTAEEISSELETPTTIGLLATSGTVRGGRFAARLSRNGISTLAPDDIGQENVMEAIYRIKGDQSEAARARCRELLQVEAARLEERGARGIIAGCTEVPLVLRPEDIGVPLFDPVALLAVHAVKAALSPKPISDLIASYRKRVKS